MESAKIKALFYADIFDYPLTTPELEKWQINDNLKFKIQNSKFEETEGYFHLRGRKEIVWQRLAREKISQKKLKKAEKAAAELQKIPFIKLIAVTGSLAMQNSQKQDDIDFLIIARKGTLWLTRFLAIILLDLKGWRRKPESKNFSDKICLNMFLEDGYLTLPTNEQDLYGAHEVYQIKPLLDKDNAYRRFLTANSWAGKFLPNGIDTEILRYSDIKKKEKSPNIPISQSLNIIEVFVKFFQLLYLRPKQTTEIILPHFIRFHPKDYRAWVLRKYAEKI